MTAVERVREFVDELDRKERVARRMGSSPLPDDGPLRVADLRAVLALAEQAAELERRIEVATGCIRRISTGTVMGAAGVLAALHALGAKPRRGKRVRR